MISFKRIGVIRVVTITTRDDRRKEGVIQQSALVSFLSDDQGHFSPGDHSHADLKSLFILEVAEFGAQSAADDFLKKWQSAAKGWRRPGYSY